MSQSEPRPSASGHFPLRPPCGPEPFGRRAVRERTTQTLHCHPKRAQRRGICTLNLLTCRFLAEPALSGKEQIPRCARDDKRRARDDSIAVSYGNRFPLGFARDMARDRSRLVFRLFATAVFFIVFSLQTRCFSSADQPNPRPVELKGHSRKCYHIGPGTMESTEWRRKS